mmetsp:Transcript_19263/g.54615  ORF Transcript_19263/g.54615 Transcript_19263/m.54615 type:complete len:248 (-) Transcript_19263:208-951(-)
MGCAGRHAARHGLPPLRRPAGPAGHRGFQPVRSAGPGPRAEGMQPRRRARELRHSRLRQRGQLGGVPVHLCGAGSGRPRCLRAPCGSGSRARAPAASGRPWQRRGPVGCGGVHGTLVVLHGHVRRRRRVLLSVLLLLHVHPDDDEDEHGHQLDAEPHVEHDGQHGDLGERHEQPDADHTEQHIVDFFGVQCHGNEHNNRHGHHQHCHKLLQSVERHCNFDHYKHDDHNYFDQCNQNQQHNPYQHEHY